MSKESTVIEQVEVSYTRDGYGAAQHRATITVAVAGAVTVGEQIFVWPGIAHQEGAAQALTFARWVVGRRLNRLLYANGPRSVLGARKDGLWGTAVEWREQGHPTLAVTLPGFTSTAEAIEVAKGLVTELIATLVPPHGAEARRELASRFPDPVPEWMAEVFADAEVHP